MYFNVSPELKTLYFIPYFTTYQLYRKKKVNFKNFNTDLVYLWNWPVQSHFSRKLCIPRANFKVSKSHPLVSSFFNFFHIFKKFLIELVTA